ncbi:hypothetical protein GE573_01302 [Bacillus velezensis]|nr:DUF3237 family protein [Bacillus velezensis]QNV52378.1 hypothetical protein GE573_01302 [Bacillus velezensis]RCX30096.1 uncharacterized protein DUF3237 [Bacillus amyloliquefaciens]
MNEPSLKKSSMDSVNRIIDPEHAYFRTVPVFETSSEAYQHLQDRLFIGAAVRLPDDIRLDVYEVQ